MFLLAKNRTDEAEKSLCWLRGWAPKEEIADEFKELQRYSKRSKSCSICFKKDQECTHPLPTIYERLVELKRKSTLKPLFIVFMIFLFSEFTGVSAMAPFIVQIFKAYESPIPPDQAAAIVGMTNNFGNIIYLCTIRYPGKRVVYLVMLVGIIISSAFISAYGFIYLPKGYNSFDQSQTVQLENKKVAYIPFIFLILWNFCTFSAIYWVPYQLLSESFPFK